MSDAKKKTLVAPKMSIKVSPLESSFEVVIPNAENFFGDDYFRFSVAADGSVEINDNRFDTKDQAVKALQAMADFLKKQ